MLPEQLIRMEGQDAELPDMEAVKYGSFQHCRILARANAVLALWRSLGMNAAYFHAASQTLTGDGCGAECGLLNRLEPQQ